MKVIQNHVDLSSQIDSRSNNYESILLRKRVFDSLDNYTEKQCKVKDEDEARDT